MGFFLLVFSMAFSAQYDETTLKEFIKLYAKHYGKKLPTQEAAHILSALVNFIDLTNNSESD
ncbi:MAG: hypothetical protein AAF611_02090 [Bacteroidota bacterium]